MIHPYLIFDFEMKAMRNFITEVKKLEKPFVNPDQEFFSFMEKLIPSEHWTKFHFDLNATKKEKWVYLGSLGLSTLKIREVTGGSPNWIAEEIKNPSNYRHYTPDESLDYLIEEWKKYRNLLPNEFFIKYLK